MHRKPAFAIARCTAVFLLGAALYLLAPVSIAADPFTQVHFLPQLLRQANAIPSTATPSATASMTVLPTGTRTPTWTPSTTPTHTNTPTGTWTALPSATPSWTASPTATATPSMTPSATTTVSPSPSATPSPSRTRTPTFTRTPTRTATHTVTPSMTATPSRTTTPTATRSFTPTATPTWTPTDAPYLDIWGVVTVAGTPAGDIRLRLGIYGIGPEPDIVATTTTQPDGEYVFRVQRNGLTPGQSYGVIYENDPNTPNPAHLLFWRTRPFEPSVGAAQTPGGNFDIAALQLISPDTTTPQPLPVTFRWEKRDPSWANAELYQLQLWDEEGNVFFSEPAPSEQYVLGGLPANLDFGMPYQWRVLIEQNNHQVGQPDRRGTGASLRTAAVVLAAP